MLNLVIQINSSQTPSNPPFLRPFLPPTVKTWLELKSYPSSEHKILQDQIPKIYAMTACSVLGLLIISPFEM